MIFKRKKFNYDASVAYLLAEYDYASNDAKHHDEIQLNILKFAFSFYTAFLATVVAIYENYGRNLVLQLALLLTTGFMIGVIFLMIMVRNRVNYIKSLMQTTNLRKFFLENIEINFLPYNKLCIKPETIRHFRFQSVYTHSMLAIVLFNCILIVGAFIMLNKYFFVIYIGNINLFVCFLLFFLVFVVQVYFTISYLYEQEKKDLRN
jgi:hypothetical protein